MQSVIWLKKVIQFFKFILILYNQNTLSKVQEQCWLILLSEITVVLQLTRFIINYTSTKLGLCALGSCFLYCET